MTKYCTIRTETNTLAMKGRTLLAAHGIRADIVRTDSAGGCANGLRVLCEKEDEARAILRRGGIPGTEKRKTENER